MPFHTPTALPIALAEAGVRVFYQHTVLSSLFTDGARIANAEGLRVTADAVPVTVPYGIRPRTHVIVGLPYVRKEFRDGDTTRRNAGFGDAMIMLKQELLDADFVGGNRRLAFFGGVTLPSGDIRSDGKMLPFALRTGAGVSTVRGQLAYSHVDHRLGVHLATGYSTALGSNEDVRSGDRFTYDLALGYRLLPAELHSLRDVNFNAYVELNGQLERPATEGGERVSDTGGHTLFVSPGLQLIPLPNLALETSLQTPLVRDPRGTQLAPDWSLAFGVRALLPPF